MTDPTSTPSSRCARILATGFGCGYFPWAPGTVGSLAGLLIFLPLRDLPLWAQLIFAGALLVIGIPVCGAAERALGGTDPSEVVLDEILGMVLVLALVSDIRYWPAAFILFRILDILKPFPVRTVERRLPGGWGIMLDDVVAAIYTVFIIQVFDFFL